MNSYILTCHLLSNFIELTLIVFPQARVYKLWRPNLTKAIWNWEVARGFIKQFASWRDEKTDNSWKGSLEFFCWTTWQSISMYFIYSWKTRFSAILMVDKLSQYNKVIWYEWICILESKYYIHSSLWVTTTSARHLASEENLDTICCFLAFQEMRSSPRKTQKSLRDFLKLI